MSRWSEAQAEYSAELARIRDAAARAQPGSATPRRRRAACVPAGKPATAAEPAVHAPRRREASEYSASDAARVWRR
jgi:hypothetical protein